MSPNVGTWIHTRPKNPKTNKNNHHAHERCDPSYSEIPEWLQEFTENLVDGNFAEPHGARVPVLK